MTSIEHRTRQTRSPAYPAVSLPTAIERAQALYERENRHAAPVPAVLRHWNYSPRSGPGFATVAAVKQFGLIEDDGRGADRLLRLSDLGLRIVQDRRPGSYERQEAVREAALRPGVYAALYERFGSEASDDNMAYSLVKDGFSESAARDVVRTYRETIDYANLSTSAKVASNESLDDAPAESPGPASSERSAPWVRRREPRVSGEGVLTIPVPVMGSEPIIVEGQFPISETDWNQFMAVLAAMKPGLVSQPAANTLAESYEGVEGTDENGED